MAEWKKVVVSGSAISQLDNDSNYLVSGDSGLSLSGSFSGSFEGDGSGLTGISADTLANSIIDGNGIADFTFNGSAGATVSVEADGSTLSVGASGVKVADAGITATQLNSSVAGDGLAGGAGTALSVNVDDSTIEINSDSLRVKSTFSASLDSRIDAAQSQATANSASIAALDTDFATDTELQALSSSASDSRDLIISDVSGLEGVQGALVAATSSYALSSSVADDITTLTGDISTNAGDISTNTGNISTNTGNISTLQGVQAALVAATASLASDISTNAGDISSLEGVQAALVAATSSYALSSSVATDITNLDSAKQDNISVSDTSGQGGIDLTFSSDTLSGTVVGLGASSNVQFADILATGDVTVQGDLTVQGTTTSINTTNLDVEDKFILLNSGSANPDEGGIVIDEGNGTGHAFLLDSASTRFGFKAALDSTTSGDVTPEAFVSAVVDIPAGHSDSAEYQKNGNIKVLANGDIYIYS
jgi:hypothetical protein